jgi:hypothetical protein
MDGAYGLHGRDAKCYKHWSDDMKGRKKLQHGWWVTVKSEGRSTFSSDNHCQDQMQTPHTGTVGLHAV